MSFPQHKLSSCMGYTLRIAKKMSVPSEVTFHLNAALYHLNLTVPLHTVPPVTICLAEVVALPGLEMCAGNVSMKPDGMKKDVNTDDQPLVQHDDMPPQNDKLAWANAFCDRAAQTDIEVISRQDCERIVHEAHNGLMKHMQQMEALQQRLRRLEAADCSAIEMHQGHSASSSSGVPMELPSAQHLSLIDSLKEQHRQRRLALKEGTIYSKQYYLNSTPLLSEFYTNC